MKHRLHLLLLPLLSLFVLSGCYFNSAGILFTKAGYKASSNVADAKVGEVVYTNGANYYVELPRYRVGKPSKIQYSAFEDDRRRVGLQPTGTTSLFQIPADFAKYLTGRASGPKTPSYLVQVKDASAIKGSATNMLPIVRSASPHRLDYQYSSPAAAWWYTAGVFDWLIVDLPVTCIENSLVLAIFYIMLAREMDN